MIVALSFVVKHGLDPLQAGMTVVYGALAGSLSPISVLGRPVVVLHPVKPRGRR